METDGKLRDTRPAQGRGAPLGRLNLLIADSNGVRLASAPI